MNPEQNGLSDQAREALRRLEQADYFEIEAEKEERRRRKNGGRKSKGRRRSGFRDEAADAFDGQDW